MGTPGCAAGWGQLPGSSVAELMGKLRHGEAAAGPYGAHAARLGAGRNASPWPPWAFQLQPRPLGPAPGTGSLPRGCRGAGAGGGAALAVPAGGQPGHSGPFHAPAAVPEPPTWAGSWAGAQEARVRGEPQSSLCCLRGGWAQSGGAHACARTRVHVHACVRARASVCLLRGEHRCPQGSPCWCHPPPPQNSSLPPSSTRRAPSAPAPAASQRRARPFPGTPWRSGRKSGN